MRYDLSKEFDCQKATKRLEKLIKDGLIVDITLYKEKRTDRQNRYYQVITAIIADELGYTHDECKIELKRELKLFYEKNGKLFVRSTADLNTAEKTEYIEKIRNWASTEGMYIPSPEEFESGEAEQYVSRNKLYL